MYFSPDNFVSNSLNRFGLYELQDFSRYEVFENKNSLIIVNIFLKQDLRNNYNRVIKPMLTNAQQPNEEGFKL